MKTILKFFLIFFFLTSCGKQMSTFGGVSITFDPRTVGMQIDDTNAKEFSW